VIAQIVLLAHGSSRMGSSLHRRTLEVGKGGLPPLLECAPFGAAGASPNYLGFMPVLIKAIQEQQTTLEQKDAELKRLKEEKDAEIKALNNRLTALEELMRQTPNQR